MAQLLLLGSDLSAGSALEQALQLVEKRLGTWASRSNTGAYNALLLKVFGAKSSKATAELQATLRGPGLAIKLEILDDATLSGINGAYTSAAPTGAERIYLNAAWLKTASAADIEAALLEEIGHAIDHKLNGPADTAGDEGEIFSALLRGITPSAAALLEDDRRLIDLNGVAVAVEASAATAPAYAAASTNPFGITDIGTYASPALADIDKDGDLDLFIGEYFGCTLFFRNTAAPGATAPAYAAASTNPFGITDVGFAAMPTFADIDGDVDLDLFIGNEEGNTLFFRNTAAPGATAPDYAAPSTNPFGITDVGFVARSAFADLDNDGDLDIFIGNSVGNTLFYRNTAAPGVSAPAYAAPSTNLFGITNVGGTITNYAAPALLDFDNDGDLDLFIGNSPGNTFFFRNTAAPGATAPAYAAASTNPFGITNLGGFATPTFGDLDNDGDLDLFIGNSVGNTLVFRNTAVDTFAPAVTINDNMGGVARGVMTFLFSFSEKVTGFDASKITVTNGTKGAFSGSGSFYTLTVTPSAAAQGNITINVITTGVTDQAGNQATAPAQYTQTFDTLTAGASAPAYAARTTNPFGISDAGSWATPSFADADRDGDLDLFIGNYDGNTLVFRNTAAPGATAPAYAAASTNPFGITDVGLTARLAFLDADGDSDLDLFIGEGSGNILFFRNTANPAGATAPSYAAGSTNPFGISSVGGGARPAFADADGDGDLDLFMGNQDGNTVFFRNTAAAGAAAPDYAAASTNPFGISDVGDGASPAFGDADGDGDLDLFIGNQGGTTLFFRNTAALGATDPAYAAASSNPFGITSGGGRPVLADLDGDGDLDLFIGDSEGNTLVFRNTASMIGVVVISDNVSGVASGDVTFTFTFSQAVTGFDATKLTVANGTKGAFSGSGSVYTLLVTPTPGRVGTITVDVSTTGVVAATGNQPNRTPAQATQAFDTRWMDTVAPTVTVNDNMGGVARGVATFLFNFSEEVTGFDASKVTVTNGTKGAFSGSGSFYSLKVTPSAGAQGTITVDVSTTGVTDPAGNQATAPAQYMQTFDTLTAGASAPAYAAPITDPFGITKSSLKTHPALVDIDADGDLDLFIGYDNGNMLFFRNTAAPGATAPAFAASSTNPFGITDVGNNARPAFGDIDNDAILISTSAIATATPSSSETPPRQAPLLLPPTPHPLPIPSASPKSASTPPRPSPISTKTAILISLSVVSTAVRCFSATPPPQPPQLRPTPHPAPIPSGFPTSAPPPPRPSEISTPTAILISSSVITAAPYWCSATPPHRAPQLPPSPHPAPIPSASPMSVSKPSRSWPISTTTAILISSSVLTSAIRCSSAIPRSSSPSPTTFPAWPTAM